MAYLHVVSPENVIIVLFYVITVGGSILVGLNTSWSSSRPSARLGRGVVFTLLSLCVFEVCSLIALRVNYGHLLYDERVNPNAWIFEEHPYMVALPQGSKRYRVDGIEITHNSLGFRGREFPAKGVKKRVVAIGGSTTYCVDVADKDTWPHQLEGSLGDSYEVLNLGVAGHGTAEHLYMMGSIASRLQPDVVVLQVGLNDLHCMHAPTISPVLNKCHSDLYANSVGQCFVAKLPRLATVRALVSILQNIGLAPKCPPDPLPGRKHSDLDPRVVEAFKAQVTALVSIARGMGAQVILVPQVGFKAASVRQGEYQWWTPYLDQSALWSLMTGMNRELQGVSQQLKVPYVDEVTQITWDDSLFVDASHLTGEGNRKLADLISAVVRTHKNATGD